MDSKPSGSNRLAGIHRTPGSWKHGSKTLNASKCFQRFQCFQGGGRTIQNSRANRAIATGFHCFQVFPAAVIVGLLPCFQLPGVLLTTGMAMDAFGSNSQRLPNASIASTR